MGSQCKVEAKRQSLLGKPAVAPSESSYMTNNDRPTTSFARRFWDHECEIQFSSASGEFCTGLFGRRERKSWG